MQTPAASATKGYLSLPSTSATRSRAGAGGWGWVPRGEDVCAVAVAQVLCPLDHLRCVPRLDVLRQALRRQNVVGLAETEPTRAWMSIHSRSLWDWVALVAAMRSRLVVVRRVLHPCDLGSGLGLLGVGVWCGRVRTARACVRRPLRQPPPRRRAGAGLPWRAPGPAPRRSGPRRSCAAQRRSEEGAWWLCDDACVTITAGDEEDA